MAKKSSGGKSLRRRTELRPELRTIVVFCEGESSEPGYVKGLKRHISQDAILDIQISNDHGVPLTLVRNAKEAVKDSEVDEVWSLFDVEAPGHHPNLGNAVNMARECGIRVAISNPCFELWLLLYHQDCSAYMDTADAESKSRRFERRSGKSIDPDFYLPYRKDAVRRARALDSRHQVGGTEFPDNNPSSGMHEFLTAIEGE